jgi:hypothetical protein
LRRPDTHTHELFCGGVDGGGIAVLRVAFALAPTDDNIRNNHAACTRIIDEEDRQEHLHPGFRAQTMESVLRGVNDRWGTNISPQQAEKLMKEMAKLPDGLGDLHMADCYRDGVGGKAQDYKLARQYYQRAADHGQPMAYYNLGWLAMKGLVPGSLPSATEAFVWYERGTKVEPSARTFELGSPERAKNDGIGLCWHGLGNCYLNGEGVKRDAMKAFECFERSAQLQCTSGITQLGYLYLNGIGRPRDATKAKQYFELGASLRESTFVIFGGVLLLICASRNSGVSCCCCCC